MENYSVCDDVDDVGLNVLRRQADIWCSVKRCFPSHSKIKCLSQSLLGHALVVLSSTEMVLYALKMKADWYLLYRCLKLTSECMLLVTCDNINYLAVCIIFEK